MFYEWYLIYLYGARILKLYFVNILWFNLNSCYIVVYVDVFYVDTVYASAYWCLLTFEMLFQVPLPLTYAAMINFRFITYIYMIWRPISWTLICTIIFSAKSCLYTYIFWCFQIIVSLYIVFTLSHFYIVIQKTVKTVFKCWGSWTLLSHSLVSIL